MPQIIEIPGVGEVEFPDGMSDQDISAAAQKLHAQAAEPAKEEKSLGGFAQNVVTSGAQLAKDTAVGAFGALKTLSETPQAIAGAVLHPRQAAENVSQFAQQVPGALRGAKDALMDRYGSLEAIGDTLYNDPVGALSDVASVASLGSAAAATKLPKVASALAAVERATNPLQAIRPAAKAVEYGTAATVSPMLKPGKSLRRQAGSRLEIERTALREGAVTAKSAGRKVKESSAVADALAANAPGTVPNARIADMPKSLQKAGRGIDVQGDLDKLAQVESEVMGSLPTAGATAPELLGKRRDLDRRMNAAIRAEQRGGEPTTIRQVGQREVQGNIRRELRAMAPGIADVDDRTRRLSLVQQAIEDANLSRGDIPMGAALVGAGGAAFGLPGAGTLGGVFAAGRMFPQIPLAAGSLPVRGSAALAKVAATDAGRSGGLAARLYELLLQRQLEQEQGTEP